MKKVIIFLAILTGLALSGWYFWPRSLKIITVDLPVPLAYHKVSPEKESSSPELVLGEKITTTTSVITTPSLEPTKIASVNLALPFTSQAPLENWEQPWQDACEEASLLMVDYYYQDIILPDKKSVAGLLLSMVAWQEKNWGQHSNLSMSEVATLAKELFNYEAEVITGLTADKIREQLRQGRPVIVPANGHLLANPYFRNDGPDYHMLVIKGFVADKFITNDPGTKRGADFIYTEENLMFSLAEWNKKESLANGPKVGLILDSN